MSGLLPLARTLGQLLGWAVDASVAEARSIGFSSAVDRALQSNSIPTSVYTSLIHTVRAALPRTMHKYTALRRRLLAARWPASAGPFELRPWDVRGWGGGGLSRLGRAHGGSCTGSMAGRVWGEA